MDNLRGAILMVIAMLGFAIEDTFIKLISDVVPIGQILFMLGLGGTVVFAIIVRAQGRHVFIKEMWSIPIGVRAIGELVGTLCFISAIILTPLSSASAILQATPLVVTLGAALFLGENVGWRRWTAIFVGLFGVLLIIRPGMDSFEPLSILALIAVICLATRDVATRRASNAISSMQLSCLGFLPLVPGGLGLMWATNTPFVMLDSHTMLLLGIAMFVAFLGYYAIVAAMRVGEVSFVTPFRYTRLIFALIAGIFIFDESPDGLMLVGAAIIVASGIYTVLREHNLKKRNARNLSKLT